MAADGAPERREGEGRAWRERYNSALADAHERFVAMESGDGARRKLGGIAWRAGVAHEWRLAMRRHLTHGLPAPERPRRPRRSGTEQVPRGLSPTGPKSGANG